MAERRTRRTECDVARVGLLRDGERAEERLREREREGGEGREKDGRRKRLTRGRRRERGRTEEEPGREKNDCFHDYNGERKRWKGRDGGWRRAAANGATRSNLLALT